MEDSKENEVSGSEISENASGSSETVENKEEMLSLVESHWRRMILEVASIQNKIPCSAFKVSAAVLPSKVSLSLFIPDNVGMTPCPLCPIEIIAANASWKIRRHLKRFHDVHSFIHRNYKFYLCRLSCLPHAHYHCMCEKIFRKMSRAKEHVLKCSTLQQASLEPYNAQVDSTDKFSDTEGLAKAVQPKDRQSENFIANSKTECSTKSKIVAMDCVSSPDPKSSSELGPILKVNESKDPLAESSVPSTADVHGKTYAVPSLDVLPNKYDLVPTLSIFHTERVDGSKHKKVECQICHRLISVKNIRRHIKAHKSDHRITAVCVDKPRGIFLVDPQSRGQEAPVHVKLKTFGSMEVQCSSIDCQTMIGPTSRGHHSFVCRHVVSAINCLSQPEPMQLCCLDDILMAKQMKDSVKQLNAHAQQMDQNTIIKYPDSLHGEYFSVFSGSRSYTSNFGRILVSLKNNIIRCPCSGSRHNCVHKAVVRWVLQLGENESSKSVEADIMDEGSCNAYQEESYERISEDSILDFDISTDWSHLEPLEKYCSDCGHQLTRRLVTNSAKVVDHYFIKTGVTLYKKICMECHKSVIYSGLKDGLLNHNNLIIMTLRFCKWLRCAVQNHTAISSEIAKLTDFHKIDYPSRDELLKGYLKFESLYQHDYNFCCNECGRYPPILVTDVNKKCSFKLKDADVTGLGAATDRVSLSSFWERVEREIVHHGTMPLKPSYDFWAPFIGKAVSSDLIVNTEHRKVPQETRRYMPESESEEDTPTLLTEDLLIELTTGKKLSEIKKMCRGHKLSAKGSRLDCLHRLKAKLKQQPVYQEVYSKFCGSSDVGTSKGVTTERNNLESRTDNVSVKGRMASPETMKGPNLMDNNRDRKQVNEPDYDKAPPSTSPSHLEAHNKLSDDCHQVKGIPKEVRLKRRSPKLEWPQQERKKVRFCKTIEPIVFDIARSAAAEVVLARHGPFAVTAGDFLSLSWGNWLTDQVIDSYLYMVAAKKASTFHVTTQTITQILDRGPLKVFQKVKLMDYDTLIGIYHQGGAHWTAVVFQNNVGDILYYDSFGEKEPVIERIQINWRRFMTERVKAGLEESCPDFTVRYSKTNHRQLDGSSCGVYALQFIEDTICGRPFLVTSPSASRNILAERLYLNSELADVYCVRCGHTSGNLVVCRNCKCKFHLKCTSQNKRKIELCFSCNNL